MSAAARLTKLEGTLSPKEATLLWLADAHQFPTLAAYVASLVDQPAEAAPFWRVPEQAERAGRAAMRGEPRSAVEAAAHQTVRDAVFLVELVLVLNVEAEEALWAGALRYAALVWQARAVAAMPIHQAPTRDRPELAGRWGEWHDVVDDAATWLEASAVAREQLELRYLDGQSILFAGAAASWQVLRSQVRSLRAVSDAAVSPAPRRRRRAVPRPHGDHPIETTTGQLAALIARRLVDEARSATAYLLGRRAADDRTGRVHVT